MPGLKKLTIAIVVMTTLTGCGEWQKENKSPSKQVSINEPYLWPNDQLDKEFVTWCKEYHMAWFEPPVIPSNPKAIATQKSRMHTVSMVLQTVAGSFWQKGTLFTFNDFVTGELRKDIKWTLVQDSFYDALELTDGNPQQAKSAINAYCPFFVSAMETLDGITLQGSDIVNLEPISRLTHVFDLSLEDNAGLKIRERLIPLWDLFAQPDSILDGVNLIRTNIPNYTDKQCRLDFLSYLDDYIAKHGLPFSIYEERVEEFRCRVTQIAP